MWQKLGDNPECSQHGVLSPVNSYGGQPAGRNGTRTTHTYYHLAFLQTSSRISSISYLKKRKHPYHLA